jgi:hypothetical protein
MAAVNLIISETLDGVAIADALAGGGSGMDFGSTVNNQFAPLIDKTANTGAQNLFIRTDATTDPITNLTVYLGLFGALTGFTYGGQRTAASDYTALKTMGQTSGSSKNNADGLSEGIWMEQQWDASTANQFDHATRPTLVKIFGDNGTDGIDLASAFLINSAAMVYNNTGTETAASAPVSGKIGKALDTVLGTNAHLKFRAYLANSWVEGGVFQAELVFGYSYTA